MWLFEEIGVLLLLTPLYVCFSPDSGVQGDLTLTVDAKCVKFDGSDENQCKNIHIRDLVESNEQLGE